MRPRTKLTLDEQYDAILAMLTEKPMTRAEISLPGLSENTIEARLKEMRGVDVRICAWVKGPGRSGYVRVWGIGCEADVPRPNTEVKRPEPKVPEHPNAEIFRLLDRCHAEGVRATG